MQRPFAVFVAAIVFVSVAVAGCAEQPGKKKEEDGKVETKAVASGGDPNAGKPADPKADPKK